MIFTVFILGRRVWTVERGFGRNLKSTGRAVSHSLQSPHWNAIAVRFDVLRLASLLSRELYTFGMRCNDMPGWLCTGIRWGWGSAGYLGDPGQGIYEGHRAQLNVADMQIRSLI